jgi:hypothetical protein
LVVTVPVVLEFEVLQTATELELPDALGAHTGCQ